MALPQQRCCRFGPTLGTAKVPRGHGDSHRNSHRKSPGLGVQTALVRGDAMGGGSHGQTLQPALRAGAWSQPVGKERRRTHSTHFHPSYSILRPGFISQPSRQLPCPCSQRAGRWGEAGKLSAPSRALASHTTGSLGSAAELFGRQKGWRDPGMLIHGNLLG